MILGHPLIGLLPVDHGGFSWFWLFGSIFPDIDHLFILLRHRIFSFGTAVERMRFEEKYGLRFKTPYVHSIIGAVVVSVAVAIISAHGAVYFFMAYCVHLLLDFPDRDEKEYFWPLKRKIRGFLPIGSKAEMIVTVALALGICAAYYW